MNVKNLAMTWLVAVPLMLLAPCALGGAEPEFYGYLDFGGSNADSGSYFKTGYVPDLAKTKIVMRYALTDNDAQSSGLLAANGYTAGSTVVGQGLAASFLFSKNKTRDLSIGYTYGTTEVNNAATFGELAGLAFKARQTLFDAEIVGQRVMIFVARGRFSEPKGGK